MKKKANNTFTILFGLVIYFSISAAADKNQADDFDANTSSTIDSQTSHSLLNPPESLNAHYYESEKKQIIYPLKLEWTPTPDATHYEVEITRNHSCSRRYFEAKENGLHIMIFPNARYLWRVIAYKGNQLQSEYSLKNRLYIRSPEGDHLVSKQELPFPEKDSSFAANDNQQARLCVYPPRQPSSYSDNTNNIDVDLPPAEESQSASFSDLPAESKEASADPQKQDLQQQRGPAYTNKNRYSLWGRAWVKAGAGGSNSAYTQDIFGDSRIEHSALSGPTFYGEVGGFLSQHFGFNLQALRGESEFEDESNLSVKEYILQSIALDAIYTLGSSWNTTKKSQWHLRLGARHTDTPIIEAFPSSSQLQSVSNQMTSASVGLGYKSYISKKIRAEINLNYVQPFSAKTSGSEFEIDSSLMFDAGVAFNYQVYKNYQLGLFWQSQFFSLDYSMDDSSDIIQGTQTILNNHVGLYFGLEF